jgi:hypothetical protein
LKCYKCDGNAEEAIFVTRNANGDFVGMRFGFYCEKCKKEVHEEGNKTQVYKDGKMIGELEE